MWDSGGRRARCPTLAATDMLLDPTAVHVIGRLTEIPPRGRRFPGIDESTHESLLPSTRSNMNARLTALLRLASFGLATAITSVVGLVAASVFVATSGAYEWGVLAAIQSAAGLFGVLVAFGWGTTGAAEIASMPAQARPQQYADSFVSRVYLIALAFPAMVAVMGLINPSHLALVVIGAFAFLAPNLGASWYFVGEARPLRLLAFEVLPQTVGIVGSIVVVLITGDLVAAIAAQLICNTVGPLISLMVIRRTATGPLRMNWSIPAAFGRLKMQRHAVTTAATSALYVSAPMLILNVVAPAALAPYAMGDRLFRVALTVFGPVLQFVQGWIPESGPQNVDHRIRQTLRLTPIAGFVGASAIASLGPWAVGVISQGNIAFGLDYSVPFALVFLVVSTTQVIGLACLVQLGRSAALALSTVLGAAIGVPTLLAGTLLFGAHGLVWALLVSECVVLIYQLVAVISELKRRRQLQATTR